MDRTIAIGTLIHGTLRDEDLLPAFADELERVAFPPPSDEPFTSLLDDARHPETTITDTYTAADIVHDLMDALQDYAPVHMYFGAIEGDGADFGWWPSLDFDGCDMRSVPMNNGSDSIDVTCGIYIHTNDHGNVTVSELRGAVIWAAV